jgi:hypothetical protein
MQKKNMKRNIFVIPIPMMLDNLVMLATISKVTAKAAKNNMMMQQSVEDETNDGF